MLNPCSAEDQNDPELAFYEFGLDGQSYLHCTGDKSFQVRRCAGGLYWNQEERTCTLDKPVQPTGVCLTYPCENSGHCVDLGSSNFKCVCKSGFTGEYCEDKIDYCSSNPCQNGGRCLSYPGGYTCVCTDKVIDDCCCSGKLKIKNFEFYYFIILFYFKEF